MKKLPSFALAFALCAVCAVSAFADATSGTTNPTSGETKITTNIPPSYFVDIPGNTAIGFNTEDTTFETKLGLSIAQLNPGYKVKVTVPNVMQLENKKDSSKTIPFTLYANKSRFNSAEFTDTTKKVELILHIDKDDWKTAPAGEYEGSVTFTITYTNEAG